MMAPKSWIACFLICTVVPCVVPAQNIVPARPFISLAGEWITPLGPLQLPGTVDESRLAPRTTDTLNTTQLTRLFPFTGKIKYRKDITIPASMAGRSWQLVMERSKPSIVWLDGDSIGSSGLILSPQYYELGKLAAGTHQLTIEVDNSPGSVPRGIHGSHAWTDATQTNWNGIIGRFGLEAHDGVLISHAQLYPLAAADTMQAVLTIRSDRSGPASISITGHTWNTDKKISLPPQIIHMMLREGEHTYRTVIALGRETVRWSEFAPALYRIQFALQAAPATDTYSLDIGLRDFAVKGTQFTINNLTTFLRGKHDACVWPLTGYPAMDKESWIKQFRIAKRYGINHYRFHSWTPPQAAFAAANEEGIYLQAELPYWGVMDKDSTVLNEFLLREGRQLLDSYGNNPSFVMMALGNELGGDQQGFMRSILDQFRAQDPRHLYAYGSNNWLGTGGQQAGEDFFVTCRVGGQVGTADYSTHARASFSFADAKAGGILNGDYPSTQHNFSEAVARCSVPVISHENGQFQVYPDYKEISKYTGVLVPYNLKIFRKRLEANGLQDQALDFHRATARFAASCYKADIEMCLRTPGFGGFQLLDLQDYPGQGSAYVGLLDAFMDSKGAISPQTFHGFCADIVPLALLPKYCFSSEDTLRAAIHIANYSNRTFRNILLEWHIRKQDGQLLAKGALPVIAERGGLSDIGDIAVPLSVISSATALTLELTMDGQHNTYPLWVYPAKAVKVAGILETDSLALALRWLKQGKKVLYTPRHDSIRQQSVGGLFTPDYWNYAMFKSISEYLGREVSPGTLSILTNPAHPLFRHFPTEMQSNWQWWAISKHSRPFILDSTAHQYKPLVQVIDNIERNHKLGLLFEWQVGKGKLMVSMCDLKAVSGYPEGRAFRQAILQYMGSAAFAPASILSEQQFRSLMEGRVTGKDIKGVQNITDYQ
ncbi:MAG: hypothetical protein P0Y53_13020 [Candidatus Pseudobacter hemicellulosilyticus]|uniref:beta-galactosidase n=1 Tax=Candidatus Pseudobacter hemicellulosilyticus TaxID=3121375 RepID=A0AAJ6BKG1_9BACT|nr:MAG: hypothetical protein P0Y53_13020 [Pseudobacter sp.]